MFTYFHIFFRWFLVAQVLMTFPYRWDATIVTGATCLSFGILYVGLLKIIKMYEVVE